MMRRATAYLREGEIYLNASSKTEVGAWIGSAPYLKVNVSDTKYLTELIIKVLEGSKEGVPHPTNFSGLVKPVLELAGVKTWGAFAKGAMCCEICEANSVVTITPTTNTGAEGFDHINSKVVSINLLPGQNLGGSLLEAFKHCE